MTRKELPTLHASWCLVGASLHAKGSIFLQELLIPRCRVSLSSVLAIGAVRTAETTTSSVVSVATTVARHIVAQHKAAPQNQRKAELQSMQQQYP